MKVSERIVGLLSTSVGGRRGEALVDVDDLFVGGRLTITADEAAELVERLAVLPAVRALLDER